jgi:hypothetical protein
MRFWVHQAVEYLLAAALMSQALQSPRPIVIGTAGILLLLLAASGDGPLRAIGPLPRSLHRTLDWVMVGGLLVSGVVFWSALDFIGVFVLLGTAAALAVVTTQTDYRPKPKRAPRGPAPSSEEVGRRAGRMVGDGVRAWRGRRGQSGDE